MRFFFIIFHNSIEGRASVTRGDTDGIHVQFNGNDTALPTAAHLFGHVEHKCGIHTVVELHGDVKVMRNLVLHVFPYLDAVTILPADSEGEQSSADNVYQLAMLAAIGLEAGVIVHGDIVLCRLTGVEDGAVCHAG